MMRNSGCTCSRHGLDKKKSGIKCWKTFLSTRAGTEMHKQNGGVLSKIIINFTFQLECAIYVDDIWNGRMPREVEKEGTKRWRHELRSRVFLCDCIKADGGWDGAKERNGRNRKENDSDYLRGSVA
ncbi:uncharacterized protein LOC107270974 isoform X2 [Cephus cinctus]|uniref:Uncharacterized protein LOC107270974 isoform X2 n=1 Tax=Cephus cinctus TaxID=211228 RepID=A0AAJ7RP14_CEPCN|nr:uncharacterized protein LOC107270974 isoform X2 [Cephus cinctus]